MQIFFLAFWIIYLFMIGATFASFFNVVGIRSADHVSLNRRSQCPKCNNTLRWVDIIPIFGYLINRGKCHFCKQKIHIKYLLIEIFGGLSFVLSFLVTGFIKLDMNYDFNSEKIILLIMYLLLVSLIMIIVVSFYEHKVILSKVPYVFAPVLIILSVFAGNFKWSMIGMGVCVLCTIIISYFDKKTVKYILYAASMGVVLGLFGTALMISIALVLTLVIKLCKKQPIFLYYASMACVISLFTSPYLYTVFTNLIG